LLFAFRARYPFLIGAIGLRLELSALFDTLGAVYATL
jgi:hypothetical protein